MRLIDLEPQFITYETIQEERDFIVGDYTSWRERGLLTEKRLVNCEYKHYVNTLIEAQGLICLCPKCFEQNKGRIGPHIIEVTFDGRGVLSHQGTQNKNDPVRWTVVGNDYNNLTITPSILLIGGCEWHGYITNSEVL